MWETNEVPSKANDGTEPMQTGNPALFEGMVISVQKTNTFFFLKLFFHLTSFISH